MFEKESRNGDYGVFVGAMYDGGARVEAVSDDVEKYDTVAFVVVHDDTKKGLTAKEREEIAIESTQSSIYWNDAESYHWMFDFKCLGHWCSMWRGDDDEPYYLAQHMIVTD